MDLASACKRSREYLCPLEQHQIEKPTPITSERKANYRQVSVPVAHSEDA